MIDIDTEMHLLADRFYAVGKELGTWSDDISRRMTQELKQAATELHALATRVRESRTPVESSAPASSSERSSAE